ncbi:trehalose-phosphatase TPS2 [Ascoidea rubescens DSM 1968]|uniref:Glycosyltransferase family 20 protein n=1 Tax=Ascoidea rubescens DSM 1968 TaxID=1344418 RepID=A0A1D2VB75_9ASCO|nr:glycosyltransferase family 20 protein [Ascoidea rubescens DSM 1968]ODV58845.1 glycosyltransferase family 20 protein [Ascoidea rubescens DSM 1968]
MTVNKPDEEAFASPSLNSDFNSSTASLSSLSQSPNDVNPKLSGRVLFATTIIPNQIYKNTSSQTKNDWTIKHLRGNSALYSSFYFLDQQTDWQTHLIAWTGELIPHDKFFTTSNNSNINNPIPTNSIDESDPLYLTEDEKSDIESKIKIANNTQNIHPIWLLRRDQQRWRKYAENVLWPAFHYIQPIPSDGKQEEEWWHDYVKFNEAYAAKIIALYKPGDIIWIHDYYLLLLPQLLRMKLSDAFIGLFIHAPFPSSEYFRCLSKRQSILDGMLGANKIGFQSYSFARHFISSCTRLLGCEATPNSVSAYGSYVNVDALPIGIDSFKIEDNAFNTPIIDKKVHAIRSLYENKKIIIGRDRLDTVRGVIQKLQAFEMFLSMYPEWVDKVVLIQLSSPAYLHENASSSVEKDVQELVAHINGTYGSLNSTPVQHYQMRVAKDEYLALLRVADLGLITSVRDGMNTTSLEFVVCQKFNKSPLILSEFSGTATVLSDALLVNPWDSVGVAKMINECLLMPDQKKSLMQQKLYHHVTTNTIQNWTNKFLSHLIDELSKIKDHNHSTPALDRPSLYSHYQSSNKRLFLFDYDGTLTPIVKEPSAAIPSIRLLNILNKLSQDPKNQIWIISGRDQEFLEQWLGSHNKKLGLSAEHGCFMKLINSENWINLAESVEMKWQEDLIEIFTYYTERTPGSFIERKKVALTWHYRKSDPEFGEFQSKQLKQHLNDTIAQQYDVEVMSGKANIEVRPKFVNKGEIVRRLITEYKSDIHNDNDNNSFSQKVYPDFVFCLGDDKTDEDMFKSLNDIEKDWFSDKSGTHIKNEFSNYGLYPTTVGPASKKTIAKAHLVDPKEVLDTLGLLIGEVSIFETPGTVSLDDRGHLKK